MAMNVNDDYTLSENKVKKKPRGPTGEGSKNTNNSYSLNPKTKSIIQILTLAIFGTIAVTVFSSAIVLLVKTERISRDLKAICEEGYCINYKFMSKLHSNDSKILTISENLDILLNNFKSMKMWGVSAIFLNDVNLNEEGVAEKLKLCVVSGNYLGIRLFIKTNYIDELQGMINAGINGFVFIGDNFDNTAKLKQYVSYLESLKRLYHNNTVVYVSKGLLDQTVVLETTNVTMAYVLPSDLKAYPEVPPKSSNKSTIISSVKNTKSSNETIFSVLMAICKGDYLELDSSLIDKNDKKLLDSLKSIYKYKKHTKKHFKKLLSFKIENNNAKYPDTTVIRRTNTEDSLKNLICVHYKANTDKVFNFDEKNMFKAEMLIKYDLKTGLEFSKVMNLTSVKFSGETVSVIEAVKIQK